MSNEKHAPHVPAGHKFCPADDITASELAQILKNLLDSQNSLFLPGSLDGLPSECLRHFTEHVVLSESALAYLGISPSSKL